MCVMHDFKPIEGMFMFTFTEQIKKGFGLFKCKNEIILYILLVCHLNNPDNNQILQMSKYDKKIYGFIL